MSIFYSLPDLERELVDHLTRISDQTDQTNEFFKKFEPLHSCLDCINFVYPYLNEFNMLESRFIPDEKSDEKANELKAEATKHFSPGKYNKALQLCTQVLMNAKGQEVMAKGYADRSAALFKLELYKECLTDIDRALAHNYPEQLKPQLLLRKQKAAELQKNQKAVKPYEEYPLVPANQSNELYPRASNCVSVETSGGRAHVVAAREIQIGEVIVVEPPLDVCIGNAELYHCHYCFNICYNPIPCDSCTQALYCCEDCKRDALRSYHQHECPILLSLNKLVKKSNGAVPLRILLCGGNDKLVKVLHLADSIAVKDFQDSRLTLTILSAIIYDLVAKHTKKFDGSYKDEDVFKGILVPYFLFALNQVNAISETVCHTERSDGRTDFFVSNDTFACALYYFNAFFRHSCNPNVIKNYHGTYQVVRAVRTIKRGEECCLSYGPLYGREALDVRRRTLEVGYGFHCKCRACEEDWPQIGFVPRGALSSSQRRRVTGMTDYNVKAVRRFIQKKIESIKRLEGYEPQLELLMQLQKLQQGYELLANKRFIM